MTLMIREGLNFELYTHANPLQYKIYDEDKQVGFVHLRWGNLTLHYPDIGEIEITMKVYDNDLLGEFPDLDEREEQLGRIASLIREIMSTEKKHGPPSGWTWEIKSKLYDQFKE